MYSNFFLKEATSARERLCLPLERRKLLNAVGMEPLLWKLEGSLNDYIFRFVKNK